MNFFNFAIIFSFVTFIVASPSVASEGNHSSNRLIFAQLERITLDQAIESALNAIPGKVVEVEMEHGVYEIKILSKEGWLSEVYVDPWDASILSVKGKHSPSSAPVLKPLTLKDARRLVEKRIRKNPNLRIGSVSEGKKNFEFEIITKNGSLVDELLVDKKTGSIRSIYDK